MVDAIMIRKIAIVCLIGALIMACHAPAEAGDSVISVYAANVLTGGGTGALDKLPVAELDDGEMAVVVVPADKTYHYSYDADSTAAESSPDVIKPDDNTGNGRWILTMSAGIADADYGDVTVSSGVLGVEDDSHSHTGSSISGIDMSDDTNLSGGRSTTMTGDALDADAELYTESKCIYIEDPTADDDLKSIWRTTIPITITSIWAESDQTVTFMLQVDDGTPADVDSSDLSPAAGTAEDTSLNGDTTMADGDRLDIDMVSVSGTPTWCAICWTFTKDD
jgi:hypothetical protein